MGRNSLYFPLNYQTHTFHYVFIFNLRRNEPISFTLHSRRPSNSLQSTWAIKGWTSINNLRVNMISLPNSLWLCEGLHLLSVVIGCEIAIGVILADILKWIWLCGVAYSWPRILVVHYYYLCLGLVLYSNCRIGVDLCGGVVWWVSL